MLRECRRVAFPSFLYGRRGGRGKRSLLYTSVPVIPKRTRGAEPTGRFYSRVSAGKERYQYPDPWVGKGRYASRVQGLLWGLIPFILVLTIFLSSCGIPAPVFLAAPEMWSGSTYLGFYHAHINDEDFFQGYELFYHIFDRENPPDDVTDINSVPDWESYANSKLSSYKRSTPSDALMEYSYSYDSLDHGFRRIFNGYESTSLPVNIMIPFDPATVSLSGGESGYLFELSPANDPAKNLELSCIEGSNPVDELSSEGDLFTYNKSAIQLFRRVFTNSSSTASELIPFFSDSYPDADDIPETIVSLSAAFFVSTTGIDPDNPGTIVVSELVYLGNIDFP